VQQDLDRAGRRLLCLGAPHDGTPTFAADGAIAWIGSLAHGLSDLRPILHDVGGPGAPNLRRCSVLELGSVRSLPDGSFLVVPGFQPGAHLFDNIGRLLRTWDTEALGIPPPRCAEISDKEKYELRFEPERRVAWVNAHAVVDEVLPLPQGPGLVVRSRGADGLVRWQLKILGAERVTTHDLPFTSNRPFDRLRGDARNGRIVLLRVPRNSLKDRDAPGELAVLEAPRG
jgi:hypothetical protein